MRKFSLAVAVLALCGVGAKAQEPRIEVFTGFSYGQFNPGAKLTESSRAFGRHFAMPGLEASGQFNLNRYLGVFADISGYGGAGDVDAFAEHTHYYNYLFGPQLTARHIGPFNVFVRGLAGTSHARVSFPNTLGNCPDGSTGANCVTTQSRFAYGVGGGIDVNATSHVALRIIQIDYLRNDFTNCTAATTGTPPCTAQAGRQDNFRAAAGFVWHF